MIATFDFWCVAFLLPFLQTLVEIALLRKGPDAIPRSVIMLSMAIILWFFAALSALVLIDRFDEMSFVEEAFSVLVAVVCYATVVVAAGRAPRLLQTITAILGCGALLTLVFVAAYGVMQPFEPGGPTRLAAWLILLWSVSIKGHIIARAIDRHWYLGLAIAVAVFALQRVVNQLISSGS